MTTQLSRLPMNVDPLIREAKQRMRRRRIVLAAVLAAVAGLGVALTFALRPAGPTPGTFRSSAGRWVPAGVAEVDVQSPGDGIFRRVTDPSQVRPIVAWFNALETQRHAIRTGLYGSACLGGYFDTITFTFRAASGREVTRGYSAPVAADVCSPIAFGPGKDPATRLVDSDPASPLITRVQRLLGLEFRRKVFGG